MKKKKEKWNYAVIETVFGDFWVGKIKLKLEKNKIFAKLDDAIFKAQELFQDAHPDFNEFADDGDEDFNDELLSDYEELAKTDNIEEIRKGMGKFITI